MNLEKLDKEYEEVGYIAEINKLIFLHLHPFRNMTIKMVIFTGSL